MLQQSTWVIILCAILITMAISPINGGDLSETKQPYIYGVACAVYVLSFIAVALRFVARRLTLASRGWDDWLILGSLFLNTALLVHILVLLKYGFGRHLESMSQYAPIMKLYLFGDIAYTTTMACTKLSILAFYWRIFGHTKILRWLAGILCGLSAIWGLQTVSRRTDREEPIFQNKVLMIRLRS